VRVASGQKIPETGENIDDTGLLSPTSTDGFEGNTPNEGAGSEGEDIADRAASLLQGLRGDGEGEPPTRDDSLRVRRRRESADDERSRRRAARRRAGGTSTEITAQSTITEENEGLTTLTVEAGDIRASDEGQMSTPTTVVVPPSPTTSERGMHGE